MKKVYFDLDGTVYDLYGQENWLELLRNEMPGAFSKNAPLVNLEMLKEVCLDLIADGWQIGIITWLPMGASLEYQEICTQEKREWVEKYMPYVSEFYAQEYGTPKQYAPIKRAKIMVLFDDNLEVRKMWETERQRKSFSANEYLLETLIDLRSGDVFNC